jgi:hypothetical protein
MRYGSKQGLQRRNCLLAALVFSSSDPVSAALSPQQRFRREHQLRVQLLRGGIDDFLGSSRVAGPGFDDQPLAALAKQRFAGPDEVLDQGQLILGGFQPHFALLRSYCLLSGWGGDLLAIALFDLEGWPSPAVPVRTLRLPFAPDGVELERDWDPRPVLRVFTRRDRPASTKALQWLEAAVAGSLQAREAEALRRRAPSDIAHRRVPGLLQIQRWTL